MAAVHDSSVDIDGDLAFVDDDEFDEVMDVPVDRASACACCRGDQVWGMEVAQPSVVDDQNVLVRRRRGSTTASSWFVRCAALFVLLGDAEVLSAAEIDRFWRDGVVVVDDVVGGDVVEELREATESPDVSAALHAAGYAEMGVHLLSVTTMHDAFRELACSPALVERVSALIGPDVQLQHSKLATKPPVEGKGAFAWHQDFAFFPHTNTDLVAVMVMLDDATPENGCMSVISGSHRFGLLDHFVDGYFTGCCQEERWNEADQVIQVMPRAGGISIHHCLALHSSPPNRSGLPRRGIVLQYRSADAHQLADTVFPDTGWQVKGSYRSEARCVDAVWRLPRWPERGFGTAWTHVGERAREWNGPDEAVTERARSTRFAS